MKKDVCVSASPPTTEISTQTGESPPIPARREAWSPTPNSKARIHIISTHVRLYGMNSARTTLTVRTRPTPPVAGLTEPTVELPTELFRHGLMTQLAKHVRPPTRRDLGTKIRKLKPIVTCGPVVEEMLSVARGLPPEDVSSGILRKTPGGVVKPTKSTSSGDTTKLKMQDPNHIHPFFSLEQKVPKRGLGAVKLNLGKAQEKLGLLAKTATMAAPPVRARVYLPKGKAARRSFPTITLSFNRCYMDENAEVTFGSMVDKYPPWMKQRLRAEMYKSYIQMGQRHLPVDPDVYSLVRYKLADTRLCGTHSVSGSPQLSDAPPVPSPPPKQSKRAAEPTSAPRTKAAKRTRYTSEKFEVEEFIEESGRWGGSSRWLVARWAHEGYEPWWEAYRNAGGEAGTPVLTWMPLREARKFLAFDRWEAAKAATSTEAS